MSGTTRRRQGRQGSGGLAEVRGKCMFFLICASVSDAMITLLCHTILCTAALCFFICSIIINAHTHVYTHKTTRICRYVHIYIYTSVYIYTYVCICIYTYICIYIYSYIHIYIYTYMWTKIYIYIYLYTQRFICIYIYVHVYIHACAGGPKGSSRKDNCASFGCSEMDFTAAPWDLRPDFRVHNGYVDSKGTQDNFCFWMFECFEHSIILLRYFMDVLWCVTLMYIHILIHIDVRIRTRACTHIFTYLYMPMYIHTCHVRKKNEKPSLYWINKVQIENHEQLT